MEPDTQRTATYRLLDKGLSEFPHLHVANPGSDYEVRCLKCGQVETYSGSSDKVNALTWGLRVIQTHSH